MRNLAAVLALGLLAASCTSGPPKAGARVIEADGVVEVRAADAGWVPLRIDDIIEPSSRVRVGTGARLRLENPDAFILVAPIGTQPAELVVGDRSLTLERGDMLLETAADRTASVMIRSIEVRVAGMVRISGSLSLRVATYRGGALAVVPGASLEIGLLRQAVIGGNALPPATTPIRLDPEDVFDGLAVPSLLNLERELAAVRSGYEAQFGRRMVRVSRLDPVSRDAGRPPFNFVRPVLDDWRAGDVVVGVVMALLRDAKGDGDLVTVFNEIRALFDEGASWAVIAGTFGLDPDTVQERVARAVALIVGEVEPGRGDPIDEPPDPEPPSTPTPTPTRSPTRGPTPTPTRTTTPSPTPTPSNSPSPSPSPTTSGSPSPSPTVPPPPTGSCQPVDQLLGNC
ncbi:MAG: hypothetical protein ACLGH3_05410 [Actinomycetota bacterium]